MITFKKNKKKKEKKIDADRLLLLDQYTRFKGKMKKQIKKKKKKKKKKKQTACLDCP